MPIREAEPNHEKKNVEVPDVQSSENTDVRLPDSNVPNRKIPDDTPIGQPISNETDNSAWSEVDFSRYHQPDTEKQPEAERGPFTIDAEKRMEKRFELIAWDTRGLNPPPVETIEPVNPDPQSVIVWAEDLGPYTPLEEDPEVSGRWSNHSLDSQQMARYPANLEIPSPNAGVSLRKYEKHLIFHSEEGPRKTPLVDIVTMSAGHPDWVSGSSNILRIDTMPIPLALLGESSAAEGQRELGLPPQIGIDEVWVRHPDYGEISFHAQLIRDGLQQCLTQCPDDAQLQDVIERMDRVTEIERKLQWGEELAPREIKFLYLEADGVQNPIYNDKRVSEISLTRDTYTDGLLILADDLGCKPENIATQKQEIGDKTVAYYGLLEEPKVVSALVAHRVSVIHTLGGEMGQLSKPIPIETIPVAGISDDGVPLPLNTLKDMFAQNGVACRGPLVEELLRTYPSDADQTVPIRVARVTPSDLGLYERYPLIDLIYERAQEVGLQLLPRNSAPWIALHARQNHAERNITLGTEFLKAGHAVYLWVINYEPKKPIAIDAKNKYRSTPDEAFYFRVPDNQREQIGKELARRTGRKPGKNPPPEEVQWLM